MKLLRALLPLLCIDGWRCAPYPTSEAVDEAVAWCRTHRCEYAGMAFDPDPALLATTEAAILGLNAASGLDLVIDHGYGIPIRAVPTTLVDGEPYCGKTSVTSLDDDVLSIEVLVAMNPPEGCLPQWTVIRHEVACHALNPQHRGPVDENGHTDEGVCASKLDHRNGLDAASLNAMCIGVGGCPNRT